MVGTFYAKKKIIQPLVKYRRYLQNNYYFSSENVSETHENHVPILGNFLTYSRPVRSSSTKQRGQGLQVLSMFLRGLLM